MPADHAYLCTFRDHGCPDQRCVLTGIGTGHAIETLRRKWKSLDTIHMERIRVVPPAAGVFNPNVIYMVAKRKNAATLMEAVLDRFVTMNPDWNALRAQLGDGEDYGVEKLEYVR
jgi:hypothetical protein